MSAKQRLLHNNARDRIHRGAGTPLEAVKVTLGARGWTALREPKKEVHLPVVPPGVL